MTQIVQTKWGPWDRAMRDELKEAYEKNKDKDTFWLQGNELVTDFAKYLLEYLDSQFQLIDGEVSGSADTAN